MPQLFKTAWKATAKRIEERKKMLYDLEFSFKGADKLWKYKKAFVSQECLESAHDSVFCQIVQFALLQNYIEPIRDYMKNSEENN